MNLNGICLSCFQNTGGLNPCPHCGADAAHIQTSAQHLAPGTILNQNYLIGKALGQGGFGITYIAWDLNAWRIVAVKEYYPSGLVTRERGMFVAPIDEEANTKLKKGVLPDARGKYWTEIRQTKEAGFYTEEEAAKVKALIDAIPERNTFIHMDYHPGNMMLQNGELMLIDVDDSGLGHPIIDLAAMYLVYVTAAKSNWKVTSQDIKKKHYDILWDRFVKRYFNTNDPKEIAEINRLIYGYSLPRFIRGVACSPSVPNILRKPIVSSAKKKLFSMIDTLHPIP